MGAAKLDLEIEQGATWNKLLVWKDSAGTPIDNSGYSARMQIRETVDSTTVILELTVANSKITLGGSNGEITLSLTDTDTTALDFTIASYDLEMISGGGLVTRLIEGIIELKKEVTR